MTQEQQKQAEARKARSIAILEGEGIPTISHLPVIEAEGAARLRTQEETVQRAACTFLNAVCAWNLLEAEAEDRKEAAAHYRRIAQSWGIWEALSRNERALFSGEGTERLIQTASWRMEAFAALAAEPEVSQRDPGVCWDRPSKKFLEEGGCPCYQGMLNYTNMGSDKENDGRKAERVSAGCRKPAG